MKKKVSKILGVALAIGVLTSLLVMPLPASGSMEAWYTEKDILPMPKTDDCLLAPVADLNIVDMAVNGDIIYAAVKGAATGNYTYKSTDAGATWVSQATKLLYPAAASFIKLVAVAPDDPDVVAIVSDNNTVYYSNNGGASWNNMSVPATGATIEDIDISAAAAGYHYLAAAGTDGTDAELYTLKLAVAQGWAARTGSGAGFHAAGQANVAAVKFSPNFATDKMITCVSGNATDNSTYFQVFRYESGAWAWNGSIAYFSAAAQADWGTGIAIGTGTYSQGITGGLAAASIALPSTFLGTEEGERIAFIGVAGTTTGGGVSRLTDAYVKHFSTWSAGAEGPIGSVAYNESGKLLAGDYDAGQVYACLSPMATAPKFERVNSLKQPGGANLTVVGWSGDTAVAATSGDESAFAVSTDSGYAFNDISMIDTTIGTIADVAVNADGSKVYLSTISGNDASVWVKASAWARVLSLPDTANNKLLVRLAPEDDTVVYVSANVSQNMWVSKNSGKESWKAIPCYKVTAVQDFAVESADVVYAIDTAGASKTTNAGASWALKKTWSTTSGYTITLAPNNDVLVGGSAGYISFSQDGGATFSTTTKTATGNVYVMADKDYADNNVIYAGVGTYVVRGKATSTAQIWENRDPTVAATQTVVGMAQHEGVIYALTSNSTDSEMHRALNLTPTVGTSSLALWSSKTTGYEFEATPQALRISTAAAEGPKLWAIDTASILASINDPIALVGPTLKSPADGASVGLNPADGRAYNVSFTWARFPHKSITACQLQIATDAAFDDAVYDTTFTGIDSNSITRVIGPHGATATNQVCEFNADTTYFWRVRVAATGPMLSPWSAANQFTIESLTKFELVSPDLGATGISTLPTFVWNDYKGAIHYEIMVAEDPTFAIIDWSRTCPRTFYRAEEALANDTLYYWRVRGVTGEAVPEKAAPGGPWVTGMFTTAPKPVEAAPPVVIEPAPPAPPAQIIEVPTPTPAPPIPSYLLWAIIGIGAILVIALIVLIVRTRRVV